MLPDTVVNRKKSPYPKTYDPNYTKFVVNVFTNNVLNKADSRIFEIFSKEKLENICKSPESTKPWFGQLMATPQFIAFLYQVEMWLSEYDVDVRI